MSAAKQSKQKPDRQEGRGNLQLALVTVALDC
jgi:hypothetical protein